MQARWAIRFFLARPVPAARWMKIVGIDGNLKAGAPDQATVPQFYIPVAQDGPLSVDFVLRTITNPIALDAPRKLDPDAVVSRIGKMEDRINESVKEPYFIPYFVMFFGSGALFLAGIGIDGIVAHESAQRTREIGIRLALGLTPPI